MKSSMILGLLALIPAVALTQNDSYEAGWWQPGSGQTLAASVEYDNPLGKVGLLNTAGAVDTKGHPFFEPIGSNGRACVTCHQPADGMSLSVESVRRRWDETGGKDPVFA